MKKIIGILSLICLFLLGGCSENSQSSTRPSSSTTTASTNDLAKNTGADKLVSNSNNSNIAIVYYSLTGATEDVAKEIQAQTNGDLYPITTVEAYPEAYSDVLEVVRQQQAENQLPELQSMAIDLAEYETIFIGSPIWFGSCSLPTQQWLTENELAGKTIHPFFTSGSSGIATANAEIESLAEDAMVSEGLGITDKDKSNAENLIASWLEAKERSL